MTSPKLLVLIVTGVSVMTSSGVDAFGDPSVCTPGTAAVPLPATKALLGDVWQANIEWNDDVQNRTVFVTDVTDMTQSKEKIVLSMPYLSDVTVLFDWATNDVIVQTVPQTDQPQQNSLECNVIMHGRTYNRYSYGGQFWLTSLQFLIDLFTRSQDAVQVGSTMVRGIQANKWSSCIFDYTTNMTVSGNIYFSDKMWQSPYLPPMAMVPVRIEFVGKIHNGSQTTNINVRGDIMAFQKMEVGQHYPTDTFVTLPGAFCPNRTGVNEDFPGFPSTLSLVMECVDNMNSRISYRGLYYDSNLGMVRYDEKSPLGEDSDPTTYIADFGTGVKYMINKYTMNCLSSPLSAGDNFVRTLPNGTLGMQTMGSYFFSDAADIQFVGRATVRDVVDCCNTWIGRYLDPDTQRMTVVQWYFTTGSWQEATGYVQEPNAFYMMKVWRDGTGSPPLIYNIMKYSPIAPDPDDFDFSACFQTQAKKHFVLEFQVGNLQALSGVNRPYLRRFIIEQLASFLEIQSNRFTDVTLDLATPVPMVPTTALFVSATMLDRTIVTNVDKDEKSLDGAFGFLRGSIPNAQLIFNLTVPGKQFVIMTGVGLVEHNYRNEFTTTTTTTATTPKIIAPTLVPPMRTSQPPPTIPKIPPTTTSVRSLSCPTSPPCVCSTATPTPARCPAITPCPSPTPCLLPGQCNCAQVTSHCPPATPCPTRATAPPATSSTGQMCTGQQKGSSSGSGISTGALAGGVTVALIVGLAIGIIATRLYHVTRVNPNLMTINLIDENM